MLKILLVSVLMVAACDVVEVEPAVDAAATVDGAAGDDAVADAACGTEARAVECVAACDPFRPSQICPGNLTDSCRAECNACAPAIAWCP